MDVDGEPRRFDGNLMPGKVARYNRNELVISQVNDDARFLYNDWMIPKKFITPEFQSLKSDVIMVGPYTDKAEKETRSPTTH